MKFHKDKFLTTVAAAALALAVGACGSSSDDDEGMSMLQTDLDAAIAKAAGLQVDLDAANVDLETAEDDLMTAQDDLMAANDMVMDLETLIGDETNPDPASVRGMLAKANMDLETAKTDLQMARDNSADVMEIDRLTNAVTAAEDMRDGYKTDLDAANLELDGDGTSEGLRAEVTRLVGELKTATDELVEAEAAKDLLEEEKMAKEDSDMAKAVLMAIAADTPPAAVPFVSGSPATLKASSAGVLTATQAVYTMSSTPPDGITGWRGATLENDGDTTVIYTNIENAAAKTIGSLYRSASDLGEPTAHYRVAVSVESGLEDILWADAKRADEDSATTGGGADAVTTFAGSVRGLAGTFSCMGDCTVPTENATTGDLADFGTAAWTFTPTDPNGTIDVPNPAYVSFGWWLNEMGTEGAYEFDAFASVEGMTANMGMGGDLKGSATYKGGAAGKWAMQSTSDDSASGGHFTANATLTANFDANLNAAAGTNDELGISIGGTINNFMTGDDSRPNWKVTLSYDHTDTDGVQPLENVGPINGVRATTKWETGGAVDGKGTWNANFYGAVTGTTDTGHPTAVVGEFNAAIGGGEIARISGGFGATKQ